MSGDTIAVVVLAGGGGRRLGGEDKALLVVEGVRLVDRVLGALRELEGPSVVVRGERPSLDGLDVPQPADAVPHAGPLGGLVAGLEAVAPTAEQAAVVAVDTPEPSVPVLRLLASRRGSADAVVPVVGGRRQPLHAVYATAAAGRLRAALESGERRLLAALERLDVREVAEQELAARGLSTRFADDVDTPDDLSRWSR